jgi:DNA-binding LacI/PurR family transcriptional regulator
MLPHRRHELILEELRLRHSLNAAEFAEKIGVSGMTIRRDLRELEDLGRLTRVHGGAVELMQGEPRVGGGVQEQGAGATGTRPATRATIGMIVPSAGYYFPDVIRGAKESAAAVHCRLMLAVSEYSPELERDQIRRLLQAKVDGLLVTTSAPIVENSETHELLLEATVPVVVVERSLDHLTRGGRLEGVRSDHAYGAELAVQHFAELGHRRVGLLTGEQVTGNWVIDGHQRALDRLGLDDDGPVERLSPSDWDDRDVLRNYVSRCRETGTSAVIVSPDQIAFSLAETAGELGMTIPRDLAIIAYDDEIAPLGAVPLTAIAPPKYEVGRLALTMCFDRIAAARSESLALRRISLMPTLNVRGSSAASSVTE